MATRELGSRRACRRQPTRRAGGRSRPISNGSSGRSAAGRRPSRSPATGFYTDTTVCIGCKACEVACKQWNQLPADGFALDRQQLRQHRRAVGHLLAAREVHRAVPDGERGADCPTGLPRRRPTAG